VTFTELTLVYLVIFSIRQLVEFRLEYLNADYIQKAKHCIPDHLKNLMDRDAYSKAVDYQLAGYKYDLIARSYGILIHWFFLIAGFQLLDSWLRGYDFHPFLTGLLFFGVYSLLSSFLNLPFAIYHDFVLEERFGFNKKTGRVFVADLLKSLVLSSVLGGLAIFALLWLMKSAGSLWWIYSVVFVLVFQLFIIVIAPQFILPLFNKLSPIKGELRQRIDNLAEAAGFPAKDILTMDGSRRSEHSNAFFFGLGKSKKIVFFDTLLEKISTRQALATLAHEIGHYKLGHIKKMFAISTAGLIVFFAVLAFLKDVSHLYPSFGFQIKSDYAALVIFTILFQEMMFPLQRFITRMSRKHEYAADAFAVELTKDPDALIEALEILHTANLSSPVTHPSYASWYHSHPDLPERITAIRQTDNTLSRKGCFDTNVSV
jgi:STE24 endopeptidase